MNDHVQPSAAVPVSLTRRIDRACYRFDVALHAGQQPRIEDFLVELPEAEPTVFLRELLELEWDYRRQHAEPFAAAEYRQRFPAHATLIDAWFAEAKAVHSSEAAVAHRLADTGPEASDAGKTDPPDHLGRHRLVDTLGQGAFGVVYKGYDEDLQRDVAIKVPHRHLVAQPADAEAYLAEARILASLDHPNIVPVYDVGRTADGLCYVVSKFIPGSDLARRLKEARPLVRESAELVAVVAEALHYAHRRGLVHRDIKPANILTDADGKPYVADFGLALKEEEVGHGPRFAGTPAYMSPEQARSEGHRVDGRSDIFSLGVVFYELLTGRRPFKSASKEELLEQITDFEPRPPRQYDDSIPRELERICQKAMAKRAVDRYPTGKDLAEDLRHFLAQQAVNHPSVPEESPSTKPVLLAAVPVASSASGTSSTAPATPMSDSQPVKIVPKGLRSFDAHDADFFLELLPGPRDRDGLPDSIRFWKTRIEETDPDNTFAVGLLYGPSGCGKSSLVKAGLLPRLAEQVIAVYVEATAGETETRLLHGLRKRCPALADHLNLKETLVVLRRGQGLPAGKKVLIVLDQFEQWLHAKREDEHTELVQALRQCDGSRVQCLVMVRDDFWMAATRFLRELEVRLVEGQNSAVADLFDLRHARKVLAAFGRAYGTLPEKATEWTKEQEAFLDQAVAGLAQERKVISVRLVLFAEMVKGMPWTPATLKEVGGTEGVGATFLDETFSSTAAPPEHRYHQKAARAVLKALLPETGTDIKGHMRSAVALLEASGYASRPKDFEDLIRILDSEIRLITPTDPEGKEGDEEPPTQVQPGQQYYQLTHDYLVPSLRDWLTRKQKETWRGRAELRLAERAALWTAKPENRYLPAWWEWLNIRLLTRSKSWKPSQHHMMRKATRYHLVRGVSLAVLLGVVTLLAFGDYNQIRKQNKADYAAGLVQRLLVAEINEVPGIINEMAGYRAWTDTQLHQEYERASEGSREKLLTSMALLPVDPSRVDYLGRQLLVVDAEKFPVLRDTLQPHQTEVARRLWGVLEDGNAEGEVRFRAACALATYAPDDARWERVRDEVAAKLASQNSLVASKWVAALRPVRGQLLVPLAAIFRESRRETERSLASDILADYAAEQAPVLADLLMDADEKQFAVLYPKFKGHGEQGLTLLLREVDKQLPLDAKEEAKEKLAKRKANAAVALLKMDRPREVWPLLKHSRDPTVRSYLLHRLGPLGADARTVVKRLEEEKDVTIRRALVLSLGEFGEKALAPPEREVLSEKLRNWYRVDPDPGLHAAVEWLLWQWKQEKWLKQMDEEWAKDKPRREQRLERIRQELAKGKDHAKPQWYVNGQGQTMVMIPGPLEFQMGSPFSEAGRRDNETLHHRRIGRTFALAAKPVTVAQFLRFREDHNYIRQVAPTVDSPVHFITWYLAAGYCNWLSEREGLGQDQWCYEPNPQGQYAQGMKLKANYLSLTGYRLPTEAEWEYACRAGAETSRYYGVSEELLGKYGVYVGNSGGLSWPVGSFKPNDLGLFDMHGNGWNWCQERLRDYVQDQGKDHIDDIEDIIDVNNGEGRVVVGGSFGAAALFVRSAVRYDYAPADRVISVGFRPARTFR
jgi:serine/threonine protein kinase/formylglycine-generating enzyme required for sulfatase activity